MKSGSGWESNPLGALFKPPTGFEDQGPHQRCKHSQWPENAGKFGLFFPRQRIVGRFHLSVHQSLRELPVIDQNAPSRTSRLRANAVGGETFAEVGAVEGSRG